MDICSLKKIFTLGLLPLIHIGLSTGQPFTTIRMMGAKRIIDNLLRLVTITNQS